MNTFLEELEAKLLNQREWLPGLCCLLKGRAGYLAERVDKAERVQMLLQSALLGSNREQGRCLLGLLIIHPARIYGRVWRKTIFKRPLIVVYGERFSEFLNGGWKFLKLIRV